MHSLIRILYEDDILIITVLLLMKGPVFGRRARKPGSGTLTSIVMIIHDPLLIQTVNENGFAIYGHLTMSNLWGGIRL